MKRTFTKLMLSTAVAATTVTGIAIPAFAQLPELFVTAQRRAESLQTVPIAVSAFSAEQMDIRQINETLDITRVIPNLVGHNNTGPASSNAYFLRGLGSTESIATFDPPVSTYVDDVYIARQNANNYALFDVERIEVLRGPQGTTFGRNTTGGAINVITRRPGDEFAAKAKFEYGEYERYSVSGVVDIPINEKVLTKFAGYYIEDEGYVDNLTTGETLNGEESYGLRGDIRFLINDDVTWDVAVEQMGQKGTNLLTSFATPRKSNTGIRSSCGSPGSLNDLVNGCGLGNDTETFSVYSNLKWDISIGTLEFITGWRDLEQDFTLDFFDGPDEPGGFSIANQGEHTQFTQEIKLNGEIGDRIEYVAGLFYMDEENDTDFSDVVPGAILGARNLKNTTENLSAYLQGDFALNDQWTLTAGARWTDEEKDIAYRDLLPLFSSVPGTLMGMPTDYTVVGSITTAELVAAGVPLEQSETKVTPKVGIEFQLNDDVLFYASATNGFKSGGWNARSLTGALNAPFGPEEAWSYEIGMKGDFLDDTLRINANIFKTDVEDLQLISGVDVMGVVEFATQNAADLDVWGAEAEIQYSGVENLDLFLSVGYIDDEYTNFTEGGLASVATGRIGSEPVRTPDWSVNLGGTYRIPLNNASGEFILGADAAWKDDHFTSVGNADGTLAEAYWLLQARAGFESEDGRWGVFAECKNCADEEYISSTFIGPYFGEPRRWNLSLRLAY